MKASSSRFPTPNYLFATASSHASSRPLETITPLAQALQRLNDPSIDTTIDASFKNKPDDMQKLVKTVLQTPATYAGKVVLICWHHGTIPALVEDFGVPKHELKGWDPFPSKVFDVMMQITWSGGQAKMAVGFSDCCSVTPHDDQRRRHAADEAVGKPPDKCGNFPSGSITTVLDAPDRDLETSPLPRMFRSCLDPLKQDPKPPSVKGLKEINASGSAQYSRGQMAAVLVRGGCASR